MLQIISILQEVITILKNSFKNVTCRNLLQWGTAIESN